MWESANVEEAVARVGSPSHCRPLNSMRVPISFLLYPWSLDCAKLWAPLLNPFLVRKPGRKSWLKKRNARIPRAHARSRQTARTAAHRVKELATQSSLIVIAVTKCVREISELVFCGRSGVAQTSVCGSAVIITD